LSERKKFSVKTLFSRIKRNDFSNEELEGFLRILLAVAVIYSLFLFAVPRIPTSFTVLYLQPQSYENKLVAGKAFFVFGIQNLEGTDANYLVGYYANDQLLEQEGILVRAGETIEKDKGFYLGDFKGNYPIKLTTQASFGNKNYQVHYWIFED